MSIPIPQPTHPTPNIIGRHLLVAVVCLLLVLQGGKDVAFCETQASPGRSPRVLILHSYYPNFTWSDNITRGIYEEFAADGQPGVELYCEFLDAKRHPEAKYLNHMADLLRMKYPDRDWFDVIICSDDQALTFLLDRADSIFPGVPLVFCGVNGYDPNMRRRGRPLTGVIEALDPKSTLEVALNLQPDTRRVLVINDITLTGRAIEASARRDFESFRERLHFSFVGDMSMAELQAEVEAIAGDAIVFLFVFNRDNEGRNFTHEASLEQIAAHCRVPIYGPWEFYLGKGIVGGMLCSGKMQGKTAARLALRILKGEFAGNIPIVMKSPNRFIFDYRQLALHKLPLEKIPTESQIINRPVSYYQRYRYPIWGTLAVLVIQGAFIILLLLNRRRLRQAEKALTASEQRYRSVVETIRDLLFIIEPNGKLNYLNPEFENLTGFSAREFLGRPFTEILAPEYIESTLNRFKRGLSGETIPIYEVELKHKDGGRAPVELKVTSLLDADGETLGRIGVARDIHERKDAEKERKRLRNQLLQVQKMEAVGTLAGGIAHDFNNVLGVIVGNAELAMMDVPEWNPGHRNLREIQKASLRARDLVNQILTFSRQTDQRLRPISISPLIQESLRMLRSSIPTTIEIKQDLSAAQDTVLSDPTQINQILINLCTNAAHAMSEKGGVLEVNLDNIEPDTLETPEIQLPDSKQFVRLIVRDSGHGINPEIINRIFDPYFTTKDIGKGTGMGLAVVHGIVTNHGGHISVKSEPGKGTTFIVLLPVFEGEPELEGEVRVVLPRGTETILLVDDEQSIIDAMQPLLERLGYKVISTASSLNALDLFRERPETFDIVITDQTMPVMTGVDLAKEIMHSRPGIPVILCTGYSDMIDEDKAVELGIRAYIMKPILLKEIAEKVREVLDKGKTTES